MVEFDFGNLFGSAPSYGGEAVCFQMNRAVGKTVGFSNHAAISERLGIIGAMENGLFHRKAAQLAGKRNAPVPVSPRTADVVSKAVRGG